MALLLSPWFWIVFAVWTGMAALGGWHQGSAYVQAKWDADKAARMEHLAKIVVENTNASDKASALAKERESALNSAYALLKGRTDKLAAQLAAYNIAPLVADRVRDAVRTANAEAGAAGKVPPDTTPTAEPAVGTGTTGLALTNWVNEVTKLYRACREEVMGFNQWWDSLVW